MRKVYAHPEVYNRITAYFCRYLLSEGGVLAALSGKASHTQVDSTVDTPRWLLRRIE